MGTLVLIAGTIAAWLLVSRDDDPSASPAQTRDGIPIERDAERWISMLHRGGIEVDLRREVTPDTGESYERSIGTVVGLGPLRDDEVRQVRTTLNELLRVRTQWLAREQKKFEKSGDPTDNLAFAKRLVDYEESVACLPAIDAKSYYTQSDDQIVPAVSGVRCVGTSTQRDGKELFVTIAIETQKHPALNAALKYLVDAEEQLARIACDEFNALSNERRQALIQKFKTASDQAKLDDRELVKYFRRGLMVTESGLLIRQ